MKAAVVSEFGRLPDYQDFAMPAPSDRQEVVVDVVAAALSPRVRSQAAGSHYTSAHDLPLIPGIDGVGRDPDGVLRYFVLPDTRFGSMADQTLVDLRRSVVLPDDCDAVRLAATMNPAMSSWIALRRRIAFEPGQRVLVLGAGGNAGSLAVQIARTLGAARVIAVGRGHERLSRLDADACVALDADSDLVKEELGAAAADVDVVLDYLWGQPTADALRAIVPRRRDDAQPLTWVQIGSVAGLEAPIPSAALRATRLQIVGSGQGSVDTRDIVDELHQLALAVGEEGWEVSARSVPLCDVAVAWVDVRSNERIVLAP